MSDLLSRLASDDVLVSALAAKAGEIRAGADGEASAELPTPPTPPTLPRQLERMTEPGIEGVIPMQMTVRPTVSRLPAMKMTPSARGTCRTTRLPEHQRGGWTRTRRTSRRPGT